MLLLAGLNLASCSGEDPLCQDAMNQHLYLTTANPMTGQYDQFASLFLAREDALILIGQLNQLIKSVQRHRGISMGLLGGNTDFLEEFTDLQQQLERRLATLEAFAKKNQLLNERDKENLSLAWATIRSNWEQDQLNDNFSLHSHFIEQLLSMVYSMARQLEVPMTAPIVFRDENTLQPQAFSSERLRLQTEILNFVARTLPEKIEHLAKIRGLATYAAALASDGAIDERRLRFLINSAREQHEHIRAQAEKLAQSTDGALKTLGNIKAKELSLLQFLNLVESVGFVGNGSRDLAHRIFNMASDIMDSYWDVVGEGLDYIRRWHLEDLEAWVRLK